MHCVYIFDEIYMLYRHIVCVYIYLITYIYIYTHTYLFWVILLICLFLALISKKDKLPPSFLGGMFQFRGNCCTVIIMMNFTPVQHWNHLAFDEYFSVNYDKLLSSKSILTASRIRRHRQLRTSLSAPLKCWPEPCVCCSNSLCAEFASQTLAWLCLLSFWSWFLENVAVSFCFKPNLSTPERALFVYSFLYLFLIVCVHTRVRLCTYVCVCVHAFECNPHRYTGYPWSWRCEFPECALGIQLRISAQDVHTFNHWVISPVTVLDSFEQCPRPWLIVLCISILMPKYYGD